MDFDEYREDVNGLVSHLKEKADYDIQPDFTIDAAFERFSIMLKDNSIKAYIKGYSEYADSSNLTNETHTGNIEFQLKVQKFFIDKLHIEMRNRQGNTITDTAKTIGHRMMTIYETERMRSYNWGVFNALKDSGEESYQVYNQSSQSIIDNRKISDSKYYDLPPDHPNSKVIIRKANEDK
jgi:hypothetical protein